MISLRVHLAMNRVVIVIRGITPSAAELGIVNAESPKVQRLMTVKMNFFRPHINLVDRIP